MEYRRVLTIAGSDSGGGAGIQADIKTISAMGCYAATAVTAVTVQNTLGVAAVHPVPPHIIRGQICAVLDDIGADAIKIGMLGSAEAVLAVGEALRSHEVRSVVLDPVMVSTSGHRLTEDGAVGAMCRELFPLATVVTPNIPEAEVLLGGRKLQALADLPDAARQLARTFGVSVLLKAGHLAEDRLADYLYDATTGRTVELPSPRINTQNTHGTGCTLSSAIASGLAKGETLLQAAMDAKTYITEAIRAGANASIGHGHGPVDHFYKLCR